MRALLSPEPPSISYLTPTRTTKPRSIFHWKIQTSLRFSAGNGNCSIRPRSMCLNVKSALDSATIDQLGLPESEIRNPSVSPSYRSWKLPKPNQTVLDAQARVCTGPTQTKPLGEEQALKVLDTILRSVAYSQMLGLGSMNGFQLFKVLDPSSWYWCIYVLSSHFNCFEVLRFPRSEKKMSKEEQEISLQYKGKDKPEDAAKCAERKMLDRKSMPLKTQTALSLLSLSLFSAKGELKDQEEVSKAQLGAFFAGMTIRANAFPEATQWSDGERCAMNKFWPLLVRVLPPDVLFIADPEGSIMGIGGSAGPHYVGNGPSEMRLVGALREVLAGGHLGYEEVQGVLRDVLPLKLEDKKSAGVSESLLSAFLIGQRMNRETDRELKAYCLAFDDELGSQPVADVRSLTHYGEPYDGNTRYFRSTLFVAAVRSCYSESCLLHGVEWMPPKGGITEEQMLKFMGANTQLSPLQAKKLLEDDEELVNLFWFRIKASNITKGQQHSIIGLREHIKKRPPLATSEKVQQLVRAQGREAIIAGFFHEGYEEPLLMLMRRRGVHSGLVVKGEEGALSMTTKLRSVNASKGLPVNYCSGFRSLSATSALELDGVSRENFNIVINAKDYGFEPTDTPRTDRSVSRNIELGLAALRGEKGPAYDRIVLNAGIADHLLGCDGAEDIFSALDRAREAIDSGKALDRLLNYIKISHKMK
ncbi:Anthranilate phosphoribosyltransferase [Vitis vinifera]|uniref:Anthranilate phosphoribosyltransferase n=1 Tax=Vitis vinifera TaxID=29760 RepID=A0A438E6P6_VITVI|nr:Anthranilate phosphoribosyltransferase [Vitis vinifera]